MGIFDKLFGRKREITDGGSQIIRHDEVCERQIGFAPVPPEWATQREDYYEQHFGKCDHVLHEATPMIPHIDIIVCNPDPAKGRDFYTLVTSGMSDLRMTAERGVPRDLLRAEIITYLSVEDYENWRSAGWNFMTEWIRFLAEFPHTFKTWLSCGHTLPNGDPPEPFLPGSLLTTAFLIAPYFEEPGVPTALKLGGETVNLLWMVLISDAECELKLSRGSDALVDVFEAGNLPRTIDLSRASYV